MSDRIAGSVMLGAAALMVTYATIGRLFGIHWPLRWVGGGHLTMAAELAGAVFFASIGSGFVLQSPLFALTALPCWLILYMSQSRANRRFDQSEDALRTENAKQHPGTFDDDPPEELAESHTDLVDVYDCGACVYLGRVPSSDLVDTIAATSDMPDQGPNDIFVIAESLESPVICPVGPQLRTLLEKYFESRDYVILRWIPVARSTNSQ